MTGWAPGTRGRQDLKLTFATSCVIWLPTTAACSRDTRIAMYASWTAKTEHEHIPVLYPAERHTFSGHDSPEKDAGTLRRTSI